MLVGRVAFAAPALNHPAGYQVWEIGITVAALTVLAIGIHRAYVRGAPRMLLMVLASASASWQETYGDWGAYVRYSDRFLQYSWPSDQWTAAVKCWWFIAGYSVFYPALYGLLLAVLAAVRRRFTGRSLYLAGLVLAFPIFYVFDLSFEASTTYLGYWNYEHTFGPALHPGNGTFPLIWPILEQVPFIALAALILVWRNERGQDFFESIAARWSSGLGRGTALVGLWIVGTNIAFLVLTTLPLLALRWSVGPQLPV